MDAEGYQPGNAVHVGVGHPQGAARVADGGLGTQRPEGDDLGNVVSTVLSAHVGYHLVAAIVLEVHIDVGHLPALQVQETLEDQTILKRLYVGDAQTVQHHACGGAASYPEYDAALPYKGGYIPHDQDVVAELGVPDDVQFVVQTPPRLFRGIPVPPLHTLPAEARQVFVRAHSVRGLVLRQAKLAEVQLHVAHICDSTGIGDRLWNVGEELLHLLGALQVIRVVNHPEPLVVQDVGVGVDADQNVLNGRVVLVYIVAVVSRHQGNPRLAAHLQERLVKPGKIRDVRVALQLQVEVTKGVLVPEGGIHCFLDAAFDYEARHLGCWAAGKGNQAASIRLQKLPVDAGLVVEPLQMRHGRQPEKILVSLHIFGQQQKMVGTLIRRSFPVATLLGKVSLQPDYGLYPRFLALRIKLNGAVQPAVVRDGEGIHAQLLGALHHWADAAEAVQEAVFGVVM